MSNIASTDQSIIHHAVVDFNFSTDVRRWPERLKRVGMRVYDQGVFRLCAPPPPKKEEKIFVGIVPSVNKETNSLRDLGHCHDIATSFGLRRIEHFIIACHIAEHFVTSRLWLRKLDWMIVALRKPVNDFDENPSFPIICRHNFSCKHGSSWSMFPAYSCQLLERGRGGVVYIGQK